jgi:hypothetical protein
MTSKQHKLGDLLDRYIEKILPSKPKDSRNVQRHLLWWKTQLGTLPLNRYKPFPNNGSNELGDNPILIILLLLE